MKKTSHQSESTRHKIRRLRWALLNTQDEVRKEIALIRKLPPVMQVLFLGMTFLRYGVLNLTIQLVSLPAYLTMTPQEAFQYFSRRQGDIYVDSYTRFLRSIKIAMAVAFVTVVAVTSAVISAIYIRTHMNPNAARQTVKVGIIKHVITLEPLIQAFKNEMSVHGWEEPKNIRYTEAFDPSVQANVQHQADRLIRSNPDLVLSIGEAATAAAQQSTATTPIIFMSSFDPVEYGFIKSFSSSQNNLVGIGGAALIGRQLDTLKEIFPDLHQIGVLSVPSDPSTQNFIRALTAHAAARKLTVQTGEVTTIDSLAGVFSRFESNRVSAIYLTQSTLLSQNVPTIAKLAVTHRMAIMSNSPANAKSGALIALYADLPSLGRDLADLADQVLRGTPPTSLSSAYPRKSFLAINLKTAQAIGVTIPHSLIDRADALY